MPYTRISGARNGADAIQYALGTEAGKGHNDNKARNQIVSTVNMFPDTVARYEDQMNRYWRKASRKNKIQIRRIVQSFSLDELDPGDPDDVAKANRIGIEFARKAYPGRQVIICTQIDGKGGLVHNHILVNNVSMADGVVPGGLSLGDGKFQDVLVPAGRGCIDEQTYFSYVKKHTNEIAAKYVSLDFGQKNQNTRSTQAERANRDLGKYVWKDDLRDRIEKARADAADLEDFFSRLPNYGVKGTKKFSKKFGDYILYELFDTSNFDPDTKIPPNLKSKSYKLGDTYGPDGLEFQRQEQEAQDQEGQAAPMQLASSEQDAEPEPAHVPAVKKSEPDPDEERRRAAARKAELERQRAARREQAIQDGLRISANVKSNGDRGEDGPVYRLRR